MNKILTFFLMIALFLSGEAIAANQPQDIESLEQRIQLLEMALLPSSANALVESYAKAVRDRNGAVQYLLFCDPLKEKNLATFQAMNWVTGTSSPSIADFKTKKIGGKKFVIDFGISLQGKVVRRMESKLTIASESKDGKVYYCISAYTPFSY